MSTKVRPERINELKDFGNRLYGQANYGKAITAYKQAFEWAEKFERENEGTLPFKLEIGDSPALKDGLMYQQDFNRLKATLLNNIASCFFNEGFIDQADKFNDKALMEDPDYARAHYRKCTILEQRGEYT